MAEGWAHALKSDRIDAHSAGVSPCFVHPLAIRVMKEAGADISGQYSKHVDELEGLEFDYVVSLCDYADSRCPVWPGQGKRVHRPFEDPIHARGTEAEVLAKFRSVRNRIRAFVDGMPENLE
ncbi:MAG: arsenate reductase ArsC [Deltaproteobacteria bacterium]|nr:arsenate reductase ArsC [Deltaproteobacteria bacterium]